MRKTIVAAAVVAGTLIGGGVAHAATECQHLRTLGIPTKPCASEDATNTCYWDAGERGNGHGHSFWVVNWGSKTCWYYLDASYNRHHHHHHCEYNDGYTG